MNAKLDSISAANQLCGERLANEHVTYAAA
jgi:hypothetical protein